MRIALHGGFGEKGRTSLGIESGGYRLLLDCGVKTSARGTPDYYPAISAATLRSIDAAIVTHAHEDHVAALGWCIANGLRGRVLMTAETRRELAACLGDYAAPEHAALALAAPIEHLPLGSDAVQLGPLRISTGRSGHVTGGVWCAVDDGSAMLVYCGDVAPGSPVFAMDPVTRCDALVIDASYGDDDQGIAERGAQIAAWVAAHPGGCVLPTPLYGRSADLLAVVPAPLFLAPGMRDALAAQLAGSDWITDGAAARLGARLDAATDWHPGESPPRGALLCHDGMGLGGPSRGILATARAQAHPTLFTGHVPAGSPGARMLAEQRAQWIRLPTHPTRSENIALASRAGAATVIGHSCDAAALVRLESHLPQLRTGLATGGQVDV